MKKQYIALSIVILVLIIGIAAQYSYMRKNPVIAPVSPVTENPTPQPIQPITGTKPTSVSPKPTPVPIKVSLTSKSWVWTKTQYSDDAIVVPKIADKFVLTFKNDKTFSLSTDCNGVGGNYEVKGNTVTFSNMISTQMFCEGSQEQAVTAMLTNTQSYLFTDAGNLVFVLRLDTGSMFFK